MEIKTCEYCNKQFSGQAKRFCSAECFYDSKRKAAGKLGKRFCTVCGKLLKYHQEKYCSKICAYACEEKAYKISQAKVGKAQTAETIEKRIASTNQIEKEAKRKATCLAKFGVDNVFKLDDYHDIFPSDPRPITPEQRVKLVEGRKAKGTYKVTEETKIKISAGLKKKFSDPDFDKSVFLNRNNFSYVKGETNGLFYRSSYEKKFIELCAEQDITLESAENTKHSIDYLAVDGAWRKYYPDFYLADYDLIVEIKPTSMLDYGNNPAKIEAAKSYFANYLVISENELFSVNVDIKEVINEYLCNRPLP